MASIVANVLNKVGGDRVPELSRAGGSRSCGTENFSTLQTVKWITLGGVGELPTVAEGAAYTELTWDDSYETATWNKKGGYLGHHARSDGQGRRRAGCARAPAALAQAAWLTLGKAVSGDLHREQRRGPTLTDTGALFNARRSRRPAGTPTWGPRR